MLLSGVLASVELGINRVLRMDSTALPRLERLTGKVIAVDCSSPTLQLFILPSDEGLLLASHWEVDPDCTLRAPAASLLRLALSQDKTAILHGPDVELEGDSHVLMELVAILQDLELDWEYELSRWLGPVASTLIGGHLRSRARWTRSSFDSLSQNLADYLSEESRTLVGQREAEARFAELDQLKQDLERLEARFERLAQSLNSSDNA
jgi:ubiquinone biosynthesis protein UbiJ